MAKLSRVMWASTDVITEVIRRMKEEMVAARLPEAFGIRYKEDRERGAGRPLNGAWKVAL